MIDVDSLKVSELKVELKARGLPLTGKKADLGKRLRQSLSEQDVLHAEPKAGSDHDAIPADDAAPPSPAKASECIAAEEILTTTNGKSVATLPLSNVQEASLHEGEQAEIPATLVQQEPEEELKVDAPVTPIPEDDDGALSMGDESEDGMEVDEAPVVQQEPAQPEACEKDLEHGDSVGEGRKRQKIESSDIGVDATETTSVTEVPKKRKPIEFPEKIAVEAKISVAADETAAPKPAAEIGAKHPRVTSPVDVDSKAAVPKVPVTQPSSTKPATQEPAVPSKRKRQAIVFQPEKPDASLAQAPKPRKRVVLDVAPPAGATCALLIQGMRRPYTPQKLRDKLSETGTIVGFWLSPVKSHAYVVFETESQAAATLKAVNGIEWPSQWHSVMLPSYVAVEEAQAFIDADGCVTLRKADSSRDGPHDPHTTAQQTDEPHTTATAIDVEGTERPRNAPRVLVQSRRKGWDGAAGDKGGLDVPVARGRGASVTVVRTVVSSGGSGGASKAPASNNERVHSDEDVVIVEDDDKDDDKVASKADVREEMDAAEEIDVLSLFNKTTVKPAIFWVPVGDDVVAARSAAVADKRGKSDVV